MTAAIKFTVTASIVVLFAFSLLFIGIRAVGMATFVVTGASMEPTIHKGSLVIDQPVTADKLRLGDVITFDHYDQTTTHRIVGIEGVVKLAVPGLGYAVAWMQYIWRLGATLVAALIFFGCAAMVFLRKDQQTAPVLVSERRTVSAPQLLPVPVAPAANVDAQRIWAEHQRWLRLAAVAQARAA
jgi:hypothetical protein